MADQSERIAQVYTRIRYEDLPAETVTVTKQFLLDSLGVLLAGSTAEGVDAVADEVASWGGTPEARVAVWGHRLSAGNAALVNAAQIHGRDFDDTHDLAGVHANVTVVPAALAVAEKLGGVDGRRLITAITLGLDLSSRVGLSLRYYQGWHYTALGGTFGSAVTAGYLLGLDAVQMQNAVGIALSMASGSLQAVRDGALTKRIQPGFSSQSGIMAALLARRGLTGPKQVFGGKFGFFNLYDGYSEANSLLRTAGHYAPENLTADLGERFESQMLSAKPYPCCRGNHASIDAVRALRRGHGIKAEDVVAVDVRISELINNLVGRPYELRANAQVDAQFNLPYAIATALLHGNVTVGDYEPDALRQPERKALADRVRITVDREIPYKLPLYLTIHTRDGGSYPLKVEQMKGEPGTMTWADYRDKYNACVPFAARPLPRAGELPGLLEQLEDVADARQVLDPIMPE